MGCVANFAQEVMQGQLSLSVGRLRGQGVEQFGRSEPLFSGLHHHLSFLDHVHEFDPDQSILGCLERFESQHGPCHPLHGSMILLHHVIHSILKFFQVDNAGMLRMTSSARYFKDGVGSRRPN
jgi:hypothetical protein